MRPGLLASLALASCFCNAAVQLDLQKEDIRAIQRVLNKRDSSLDWFRVLAKKPVDTTRSVILVEAAPTELRPGVSKRSPVWPKMQVGVFVVSGMDNRVQLVLDSYPLHDVVATPQLDEPADHSVCLHFYSDYGMYEGSVKYIYDLSGGTPVQKIPYRIGALTSSTLEKGKLRYAASFGSEHRVIIIEPALGNLMPGFKVLNTSAPIDAIQPPARLRASNGESIIVANKTPPGQLHQVSGIYVLGKSNTKHLFPAPIPSMDFYRKILPGHQPPAEISSDIGPFILSGTTLWFATSFYDGEGASGIGAVGSFDIPARKYQMRYLPEIIGWSGSAIVLDAQDLWIGLMRRPEGANYGGGLLRYNIESGTATKYPVPDVINTIDRLGDTLYCGTSHGLYILRDDKLTQLRFEPDGKGKLSMVAREVRFN